MLMKKTSEPGLFFFATKIMQGFVCIHPKI